MSTKNFDQIIIDINHRSVWALARDADCLTPDTDKGQAFLVNVRDAVMERIEEGEWDDVADFDRLFGDIVWEIADSAVPIYTHDLWTVFGDLGAYFEDPTELGFEGEDMNKGASTCLYMIADRLAASLREEVRDAIEADEEGDVQS